MDNNGGSFGGATEQANTSNSASNIAQTTITTENGTTIVGQMTDTSQDLSDFKTESKWEFTPLEKASYECTDMYLEPSQTQEQQKQPKLDLQQEQESKNEQELKVESEPVQTPQVASEPLTKLSTVLEIEPTVQLEPMKAVDLESEPQADSEPSLPTDNKSEPTLEPEGLEQEEKQEQKRDSKLELTTDLKPEMVQEIDQVPHQNPIEEQNPQRQQDGEIVSYLNKEENVVPTEDDKELEKNSEVESDQESIVEPKLEEETIHNSAADGEPDTESADVSEKNLEQQPESNPEVKSEVESPETQELQQRETEVENDLKGVENTAPEGDVEQTNLSSASPHKEEDTPLAAQVEAPVARPVRASRTRQSSVRLQPIETVKPTRSTRKSRIAQEEPCNVIDKSNHNQREEDSSNQDEAAENEEKEQEPEAMLVEEPVKPSRVSRGRNSTKNHISELPKIKVDRRPSKRQMDSESSMDIEESSHSVTKTPTQRRSKIPKITLRPNDKPTTSIGSPELTSSASWKERSSVPCNITKLSSYRDSDRRRTYENDGIGRKYRCKQCGFSTDRLNNIVYHHKHLYLCKGGQKLHEAMVEQWKHSPEFAKGNKRRYMKQ